MWIWRNLGSGNESLRGEVQESSHLVLPRVSYVNSDDYFDFQAVLSNRTFCDVVLKVL